MKLSRKSIPYRSLKNSGSIAAVLIFTGSFSVQEFSLTSLAVLAAAAGILLLVSVLWQFLVWRNYSFSVEKDSIRIRHGVLRKHDREIPLRRIQNVDITRNIVHRILDIAQANLETAGGSDSEASFRYLDTSEARDLQEKIRRKKGDESQEKDRDEGIEKQEAIYEITDKELVLLGVASIDRKIVGGLFAVLFFFPAFIGGLMDSTGLGLLTGLTLLFTGLVVVAWISSTVSVVLKYWGFKLYDRGESLEYERGLLNRSEGNIPKEKIQKLYFEENPLKRLLGYSTLKIETAGYSPSQSMEKGSEAAIPLAKHSRTVEIANRIEKIGNIDIQKIPGRARQRYSARYILVSLFLIGISLGVNRVTEGELFILNYLSASLIPVAIVAAHYKWKNKGYGVADNHFLTMNGFWNRKTMIVPYYRIQTLIESQTILQRQWNLSKLTLDTAGSGKILDDAKAVDLDTAELEEVKNHIYRDFQQSIKK